MKGTYYFLIKPLDKRYNNTKSIGDKELIVNTEIFNHQYVSREAVVVGLPSEFETPIKKGDTVIVHHNIFRRWHDMKGVEKNSASFILEDLYSAEINQIYAYKRNNSWNTLPGYSFIKPLSTEDGLEKRNVGIVKYSDNNQLINKMVGYLPIGEYEFIIDNQKFYRVRNKYIAIKYEYKGEEKEYNPSWLQSS